MGCNRWLRLDEPLCGARWGFKLSNTHVLESPFSSITSHTTISLHKFAFRLKTPWKTVPSSTRWWRCMTMPLRAQRTLSSVKETPLTSLEKVRPCRLTSHWTHCPWIGSSLSWVELPLHVSPSHCLAVNEEWLEGHCAGSIGIFPSCFVYREDANILSSQLWFSKAGVLLCGYLHLWMYIEHCSDFEILLKYSFSGDERKWGLWTKCLY